MISNKLDLHKIELSTIKQGDTENWSVCGATQFAHHTWLSLKIVADDLPLPLCLGWIEHTWVLTPPTNNNSETIAFAKYRNQECFIFVVWLYLWEPPRPRLTPPRILPSPWWYQHWNWLLHSHFKALTYKGQSLCWANNARHRVRTVAVAVAVASCSVMKWKVKDALGPPGTSTTPTSITRATV